jgi:hypothetical protein
VAPRANREVQGSNSFVVYLAFLARYLRVRSAPDIALPVLGLPRGLVVTEIGGVFIVTGFGGGFSVTFIVTGLGML